MTTTTATPPAGALAYRRRVAEHTGHPGDRPPFVHQTGIPRDSAAGPSHRNFRDRPTPSTTTEREHDVFTASPVLEREQLSPPVPPESDRPFDPADEFLLGQPRHVTDRLPCRVQDADLWFAEIPADLERAKAFCVDCPAVAACLAGALTRREPWGVWGGEIFDHGVIIARKRPRGRPRKDGVAA